MVGVDKIVLLVDGALATYHDTAAIKYRRIRGYIPETYSLTSRY